MFVLGSALATKPLLPLPIAILPPLLILGIHVVMVIYCVEDLYKPERRVSGGNKDLWALIILFIGIIGPALYLLYGRER